MFLSKFDFISSEITLYYRGKERHSSISSGIISILLIIFIIALLLYLSFDFLFKKNPSSIFYKNYIDEVGKYYLNSSSLFHFVFLNLADSFNVTIDNRFFNIVGITVHDGTYITNTNLTNYDFYIYGPCDFEDVGELKDVLIDDYLEYFKYSYCIKKFYNKTTKTLITKKDPKFIYPSIEHGASKKDNTYYNIYILRCQNITIVNNNTCYSEDYRANYNEYLYNIIFINQNGYVNDFRNPIHYNFQRVSNLFNQKTYSANHLNLSPLFIITDAGNFFESKSSIKTFTYDFNEKLITESDIIFGSFHFWMQNEASFYERTYKKLQDISGNIDGTLEIFMLIIKGLNFLFFNEYQILHDFNEEIEKQIKEKYKKQNLHNSSIIKKKSLIYDNKINFNTNIQRRSFINMSPLMMHTKITTRKKNSKKILKSIKTEIEKEFKKITWYEALCGTKFLNKNIYINFIKNKRIKILSEESILKFYINISKIKEFMFVNNEPLNNNEPLKNNNNSNKNIDNIIKLNSINYIEENFSNHILKENENNYKSSKFRINYNLDD